MGFTEIKGFSLNWKGYNQRFLKFLYDEVIKNNPTTILEFGTGFGYTTCAMAMALKHLNNGGKIHTYDSYTPNRIWKIKSSKDIVYSNLSKYITLEGKDILDEIIREKKSVVFISAHFNNFELMALCLEKAGIDLAAIYRPLNNFFLNNTMENIRKKYICRNQIKKGKSGSREILKFIKQNFSIALMIDQRVSEGVKSNFFNRLALTTSIPAQIIKKYELEIVPVYIERKNKIYFNMSIDKPIKFNNKSEIIDITNRLNNVIEKRILSNPSQWIWTHNRWK